MSMTAAEHPASHLGHFGNFEARMLRSFRGVVEDWDEVCSSLGVWEAEQLAAGNSASAKVQHCNWVADLLAWGHVLVRATEDKAFPDPELSLRVKARLRHLEDKLALWHGEMSSAEEDRILGTAFA